MALLPKEEFYIVLSDLLSAKHLVERFKEMPTISFFKTLVENEEFRFHRAQFAQISYSTLSLALTSAFDIPRIAMRLALDVAPD